MIASGAYTEDTATPFKVDGNSMPCRFTSIGWVVLYNTKLFKDAGVQEPKTWDELIAVADKLKAAGITPFVATTQDGWRGFIWFEEIMIRTNPKAYLGLSRRHGAAMTDPRSARSSRSGPTCTPRATSPIRARTRRCRTSLAARAR